MNMAHQMQTQQKVQQQVGHPMQTCAFLQSAPMGVPKPYETSKKSLTVGTEEQEHLSREARAAEALFTHTGRMGETDGVDTACASDRDR